MFYSDCRPTNKRLPPRPLRPFPPTLPQPLVSPLTPTSAFPPLVPHRKEGGRPLSDGGSAVWGPPVVGARASATTSSGDGQSPRRANPARMVAHRPYPAARRVRGWKGGAAALRARPRPVLCGSPRRRAPLPRCGRRRRRPSRGELPRSGGAPASASQPPQKADLERSVLRQLYPQSSLRPTSAKKRRHANAMEPLPKGPREAGGGLELLQAVVEGVEDPVARHDDEVHRLKRAHLRRCGTQYFGVT